MTTLANAIAALRGANIPGLDAPPSGEAAQVEWVKRGAIAANLWATLQKLCPDDGSLSALGYSYRDQFAADFIRVVLSDTALYLSGGFPIKYENPDKETLDSTLFSLVKFGFLTRNQVDDIIWLGNNDNTGRLLNLRIIPRFDTVVGGGSANDCRVTQTPEQCFEFTFDGYTTRSCQPGFELRICDIFVRLSPAVFPAYWCVYRQISPNSIRFDRSNGFYFVTATDIPAFVKLAELNGAGLTLSRTFDATYRRMIEGISKQFQEIAKKAAEARKKSDRAFWIEFVTTMIALGTGLSALAGALAGPGILSTQGIAATVRVADAFPGTDFGDVSKALKIYNQFESIGSDVINSFSQGDSMDWLDVDNYVDTSNVDLTEVFEESGGFDWLDSMQFDLSELTNWGFDLSSFTLPVDDVDLFDTFIQSGGVFYDDLGNGIDASGYFSEVTPETYAQSLYLDESANLRDMTNRVVATNEELAQIADQPAEVFNEFIGDRLDSFWSGQNTLVPVQGSGARPAAIGAPSANGLSIIGNIQNGWQALIAGLSLAPQVYREYRNARGQIAQTGTYRPNVATNPNGAINPQVPGQRITMNDGSVAVRQPNGTTIIQRPDGTQQTIRNNTAPVNPVVATTFGIDNRLLIGGAVALGALLLLRGRK